MDDEIALERASQQVIKILLREPAFLEEWQKTVSDELEKKQWTSGKLEASNPINFMESAVSELSTTIEYVVSVYELNVYPRDCYLSEAEQSNRNASQLFETGFRVERLTSLDMKMAEKEAVVSQISASCRRVNQVLKSCGRRFQGQQSLEIRSLQATVRRLCRLFYTLAEEIGRFSSVFEGFRQDEQKAVQRLSRKLQASSDEFNLRVVEPVEQTTINMEKEKRRESKTSTRSRAASSISVLPSSVSRRKPTLLQKLKSERQIRLVSSVQEAIRPVETNGERSRKNGPRRTHVAGGIATSIVEKNGLLYEKAKPKLLTSHLSFKKSIDPIMVNIDSDRNPLGEEDYEVMESAMRVTGLVIADMRQTMSLDNDEHIVLGVGK